MSQPEPCVICQKPSAGYLADYPLCEPCYAAISAPDPICFDCGEPLTGADLEANETSCAACRANAPPAGDEETEDE